MCPFPLLTGIVKLTKSESDGTFYGWIIVMLRDPENCEVVKKEYFFHSHQQRDLLWVGEKLLWNPTHPQKPQDGEAVIFYPKGDELVASHWAFAIQTLTLVQQ